MVGGKALLDYTNLYSRKDYKKNDKIIYKYFKDKYEKPQVEMKKTRWNKKLSLKKIKHNDLMGEKHKRPASI